MVMRVAGHGVRAHLDDDELVAGLECVRSRWPDSDSALLSLEHIRWPSGARCPRCKGTLVSLRNYGTGKRWFCSAPCCVSNPTFSVRTHTFMHGSRILNHDWLAILFVLTASDYKITSVSAADLVGAVSHSGISVIRQKLMLFANATFRQTALTSGDVAVKLYLAKRRAWQEYQRDAYRKRYLK